MMPLRQSATLNKDDLHDLDVVKGPSDRKFGFTIGVILIAIGLAPMVTSGNPFIPFLGIGFALIFPAIFFPKLLHFPNICWMKLSLVMNTFIAPLIIGAIYFLIVTPYAIFLRLILRKKFLDLKYEINQRSYWIEKTPAGPPAETMPRQF